MCKRILTIVLVLSFSVTALAQPPAGNITQSGDTNLAQIFQVSEGQTNQASINQKGTHDWAGIVQYYGEENTASITQKDNTDNWALIIQPFVTRSEAFITQNGAENVAVTLQMPGGVDNWADMSQKGNNNGPLTCGVECGQWEGLCYYFDLCGDGCGNGWVGEWETGLLAFCCSQQDTRCFTQYQNGSNNTAQTGIVGDNNQTAQWQDGCCNMADIKITNDNNIVKQIQFSDNNWGEIEVSGMGNKVCQFQDGGHISTVTVSGDYNTAAVFGSLNWSD